LIAISITVTPLATPSFPTRRSSDLSPPHLGPRQLGGDPPRPIARVPERERHDPLFEVRADLVGHPRPPALAHVQRFQAPTVDALDRKSTRLNSSHRTISYAVFCLKK